jgi:4-oxalocrotonate tautomerase
MPHIIVKLYPGRTEEQKNRLAEAITKVVVEIAKCPEEAVSLAIEEISPEHWDKKVYQLDILNKEHSLYKIPGDSPSE